MQPLRHPATSLALAWIAFLASVGYVAARVPERLATHFDWAGHPNGWMSRPGYVGFMLLIGFALPLFLVGCCWATAFLPPSLVNLPHKDYWLAPEHREETARWLTRYSLWLAVMMVLFLTGLNLLTLQANAQPSAQLSNPLVFSLAGVLLAGTAVWCVGLYRRFARPA